MLLELRYLALKWDKKRNLISFAKDHYPIEVLPDDNSSLRFFAETTAFVQGDAKFVGLKLSKELASATPYIDANGQRKDLIAIKDPATGETWWVELAKWLNNKTSYGSQLYWSIGELNIIINQYVLVLHSSEETLSKEELDYCLKDFKNELWRIMMNENSSITGQASRQVPNIFESDIFKYAQQFISSVETILKEPKYVLREIQHKIARKKVRPVTKTFREMATQPDARLLTSRAHQLNYDTSENRYIHYCVDRLLTILRSVSRIFESYKEKFDDEIRSQDSYIDQLSSNNTKKIDKTIFINELIALQNKNEQLKESLQKINANIKEAEKHSQNCSSTCYVFNDSHAQSRQEPQTHEMTFGGKNKFQENCFFVNEFEGKNLRQHYNLQYILCAFSQQAISQLNNQELSLDFTNQKALISGHYLWQERQVNKSGNTYQKVILHSLTRLELLDQKQGKSKSFQLEIGIGDEYYQHDKATYFLLLEGPHPAQNTQIKYNIIKFEEDYIKKQIDKIKELENTRNIKIKIEFTGSYYIDESGTGKSYCCFVCSKLISVELVSSKIANALNIKQKKFQEYENSDWISSFTRKEQEERKKELEIAKSKRQALANALNTISNRNPQLDRTCSSLVRLKKALSSLKVKADSTFPNSMVFVQNPAYASAHSSFRLILKNSGIDIDQLEMLLIVDKIQITNISALYERWCLLQIIGLIVDTFQFKPVSNWKSDLLTASTSNSTIRDLSFVFENKRVYKKITLSYEKELPNKKRPDFILCLDMPKYFIENDEWKYESGHQIKLVMDAKFKGKVTQGYMNALVADLYQNKDENGKHGKNYSEDHKNLVFILHATPEIISIKEKSSPLAWGDFCDYGQKHDTNHRYGHIYVSPSIKHPGSIKNLQRLIGMFLQSYSQVLSYYNDEEAGRVYCTSINPEKLDYYTSTRFNKLSYYRGTSFIASIDRTRNKANSLEFCYTDFQCISCGTPSQNSLWQKTMQGDKWKMECTLCSSYLMKTFCYYCGTELYKNDHSWTYHQTISDQIGHIVCPKCGSYFESDFDR